MLKHLARRALRDNWYHVGAVRRSWAGPYRGVKWRISEDQVTTGRLCVIYGAFEPEVCAALRLLVRPGAVVFDVGANIGVHTLYAALLLRGSGRVVSFEPDPSNRKALVDNLACNPRLAGCVTVYPQAVGSTSGSSFLLRSSSTGSHRLVTAPCERAIEVGITTLDDFCAGGEPSPHVIKVDVEGEELAVLQGAERTLRESAPNLILEHHHGVFRGKIEDWLRKRSYHIESLGDRHVLGRRLVS